MGEKFLQNFNRKPRTEETLGKRSRTKGLLLKYASNKYDKNVDWIQVAGIK